MKVLCVTLNTKNLKLGGVYTVDYSTSLHYSIKENGGLKYPKAYFESIDTK
jgi:hypothetical protein